MLSFKFQSPSFIINCVRASPKKNSRVPIVNNVAEDKDLNLEKHFKNRMKYAERPEFIEIDRTKGSSDKTCQQYVLLNVQTGLFEAMKKSMLRILTDTLHLRFSDNKNPRVDLYGALGSELKYQLYIKYKKFDKDYSVKIDLNNTKCTIGVYG